jgi:hypothetical protein
MDLEIDLNLKYACPIYCSVGPAKQGQAVCSYQFEPIPVSAGNPKSLSSRIFSEATQPV